MKRLIITTLIFISAVKLNFAQVELNQAKANFIYNFTKFFDWPVSEKTGDFVIGVLGSKSLSSSLEKVTAGKKNVTQNIVIKYFNNINEVTKCQVIYVDAIKTNDINNIHEKTGVHCLIISDGYNAIQRGAIIQFVVDGDRLKYEFSQSNALKHGLKFHSKVSEMASKTY